MLRKRLQFLRYRLIAISAISPHYLGWVYFIWLTTALIDFDRPINLPPRVSRRQKTRRGSTRTLRRKQKHARKPIVPVTKKKPKENRSLNNQ